MEIEVWKPIEGYEGIYEVSSFGRVKSLARTFICGNGSLRKTSDRILAFSEKLSYYRVTLYKNGSYKIKSVHRLVAETFLSNPLGLKEVNHINENKHDNRVLNLEWCSHLYNCRYGTRNVRAALKNRNGFYSKPVVQLTLDGNFIARFESSAEVKRQLGFASQNISNCCLHKPRYKTCHGYKWLYESEYNELNKNG